MIKHVLKTLVAVLAIATAAAGPAWGQNGNLLTTVTATGLTTYDETTPGVVNVILDGQLEYNNDDGWMAEYVPGNQGSVTVTAKPGFSIDSCKFYVYYYSSYQDSYTVTAAPFAVYPYCEGSMQKVYPQPNAQGNEFGYFGGVKRIEVYGTALPPTPHTVRMAEGTEDAANWTVTPAEALTTGIIAGSTLTATYAGDLKVKEVIATKHPDPNEIPLTIEALTAGTVVVQQPKSGMKYTLNGGAKTAMTGDPTVITVAVGDKVAFYGNGTSITSYIGTRISGGTADVKAYGNIMSLVNETGFATATTLTANDAFSNLFGDYANLKDISGLLLPATTLARSCYATMFYNCTGLTTVPSDLLPATTLAKSCYVAMFAGCVNLTNVPTLPATTLAQFCYNNMFLACNGLTTVPTDLLPATTLAEQCYSYMFLNCSNLTTAPALPATTLAEKCYSNMFANCTALATVPDTLPATTLAENCYQQMFDGCENLAASPVLPATTLVNSCYSNMFYNCYNLSSVTCLATSGINQNSSTEYWLEHAGNAVQGTKTVNAASSANWPMNNDNGIPYGWTLVTPPTPLTIEALTAGNVVVQNPQSGMQYTLNGGAKTAMTEAPTVITVAVGDKVQLYGDGTSITSYGGTRIGGYDCTAEVKVYGNIMSLVNETGFDTATTLTGDHAFHSLFESYFNLNDISGLKLPATTLTEGCYDGMFSYCTGLTTVPSDLLPATTLAMGCYAGMFGGCENLTTVPTLPATTLAESCYNNMFSYCTGLTTVPSDLLPATTLAIDCYSYMFFYCTNLTTAPVLPATTLADACYIDMFASCYKLSSVTCLATSGINQNNSTESWLYNAGSSVQGTKTFNAVSTAEWPTSSNGIPSGWTRQNIDN